MRVGVSSAVLFPPVKMYQPHSRHFLSSLQRTPEIPPE